MAANYRDAPGHTPGQGELDFTDNNKTKNLWLPGHIFFMQTSFLNDSLKHASEIRIWVFSKEFLPIVYICSPSENF